MSVEQLLGKNDSIAIIEAQNRFITERSGPKSPVFIVASAYISQAKEAIKSIANRYQRPHEGAVSQEDFLKRLKPDDHKALFLNYAGLVMGISIHVLEDALVERRVAGANISAEYNMAVSSTPFETAQVGEEVVEQIPDDLWSEMIAWVGKDPTFGTFFSDGCDALPRSVGEMLENTNTRGIISERIIPAYREQVKFLIAQNGRG